MKADLERVWLQIDEHGRGIIDSNKLGDLTSNLGQTLNEDEMDEMIRALCSGKSSGKAGGDKGTRKWMFDKGVNDAHKGKGDWHKGKGDSGKGDWNRGDAGKGKGKDKRREKGWY